MRFDKRGIAASASALQSEAELRFDHYVDDAAAWVQCLRADSRFSSVAILGHSEGSLIGIAAANKVSGLSGVISVAGLGRPADELIREQLANESKDIRDESHAIMEELKKGNTVSNVRRELQALFRPSVQPYLISWFKYDPLRNSKTGCPGVDYSRHNRFTVLLGMRSCWQRQSLTRLEIIDGMNHILKEAP